MIAAASQQDIPALVVLINSAYRGEGSKQGWTTEADLIGGLRTDEADLLAVFNAPDTTFYKYTDENNAIIGCVRLQRKEEKLYLGMLAVSPMLQAKGIGKQLLQTAEMHARQHNCRTIFMTVFSARPELIAWYERHGYCPTGEVIPFQPNKKFEIVTQQLEFWVLEKAVSV